MSALPAGLQARKDLDPGWWRTQTGPAQVVIVAVAAVTLIILFWLLFEQGSGVPQAVPSVVGQGEAIALKQLGAAGFNHVTTHDAFGRDRSGQAQQWQVCFQLPAPGRLRRTGTRISLGLVKIDESCLSPAVGDQGLVDPIGLNEALPDFTRPTNWTAYIVRQDLGKDASVRFLDHADPRHQITDDLGDWLICAQSPPAHQPWHGRPITLRVARYDQGCH